jgi:hypothetical protein
MARVTDGCRPADAENDANVGKPRFPARGARRSGVSLARKVESGIGVLLAKPVFGIDYKISGGIIFAVRQTNKSDRLRASRYCSR